MHPLSAIPPTPICNVSRVHFLIHPMFEGDPNRRGPAPEPELTTSAVRARFLGLQYREVAGRLSSNELLFAFTHLNREDLYDRQDLYARYLRGFFGALHQILGLRFFLETNDADIFNDYSVAGKLFHEARRRGYRINRETEGVAYGETLLECVRAASANLTEAFDFRKPTTIEIGLTEAIYWWHHTDEEGRSFLRTRFQSLGLHLNESFSAPWI